MVTGRISSRNLAPLTFGNTGRTYTTDDDRVDLTDPIVMKTSREHYHNQKMWIIRKE